LNRRPWFSTWLLNYFVRENDSLVGDIAQQYSEGLSRAWYWRQVFAAIVLNFATETRQNRGLVTKAIFRAWFSWILICLAAAVPVILVIGFLPRTSGMTNTQPVPIWVELVPLFFSAVVTLKVGQIVARLDERRKTTLVLWAASSFVLLDLLRIAVIGVGLINDPLWPPALDVLITPVLMLVGAGTTSRTVDSTRAL
jgi:hypothetical protein